MDRIEAELQHMIAVEHGDTDLAAAIREAWDIAQSEHARNARKGWAWTIAASAALWTGAIVVAVHLLTQLVP